MLSLLATSDFNPVSEFTDFINHPYVDLPLGLDINKGVVYLWLSAATAILVPLLIIRKGLRATPSRWPRAVSRACTGASRSVIRTDRTSNETRYDAALRPARMITTAAAMVRTPTTDRP